LVQERLESSSHPPANIVRRRTEKIKGMFSHPEQRYAHANFYERKRGSPPFSSTLQQCFL